MCGGLLLLNAGLQFEWGTNPTVGVVGSIELSNPPITMNAAIRLTNEGVKLKGSMKGCWSKAFGIEFLTICNLLLSTTLPISGLEYGGRVEVGKQSCGQVLTAEGYVGKNELYPSENYFYADVGPVTFQDFLDAFCINVGVPKPLGDSGFPNGFKTSFSPMGKELPHAGISIPMGFRFRGTLNFLGLLAYTDIYVQIPRITIKIDLPPLSIGGVLNMYKSSTNKTAGPFVNAEISTKQVPNIEASGYVEVFRISDEAKLFMTSTMYQLEITGKFLNLFNVHLRITAKYSKSITSGRFIVEGWFPNDLFERIANALRNALEKSADEANQYIRAAQNRLNEIKAKFDRANKIRNQY